MIIQEVEKYRIAPNVVLVCPRECIESCDTAFCDAMDIASVGACLEEGGPIIATQQGTLMIEKDGSTHEAPALDIEIVCRGMRRKYLLVGDRVCRHSLGVGITTGHPEELDRP